MNKHGELSAADIKLMEEIDYHDFHVKSHIVFNDYEYDQRLDYLRYSNLDFEYSAGMDELSRLPKKYKEKTQRGKTLSRTRLRNKLLKIKELKKELNESLD